MSLPSRERGLKFPSLPLLPMLLWSLPSRERGLKFWIVNMRLCKGRSEAVAPLAGAWIEIHIPIKWRIPFLVAPLAGAWIEIAFINNRDTVAWTSLPSRERGLKLFDHSRRCAIDPSRSPRGSVD